MYAWSPDGYYNFLLKCSVKIRVHVLERGIGVRRDSDYKINVGHCITFEHWPAGCKALVNSVLINKLEELKYFKYDIWKRSVRKKKSPKQNQPNKKPNFKRLLFSRGIQAEQSVGMGF